MQHPAADVDADGRVRGEHLRGTHELLPGVAVWQPLNGIVFALDGILIGAGDLRFLAYAMWVASMVLIAGAFSVLWLDLGIGWLWGAIGAWMVARAAALIWRFQTDSWQVTGAVR